MVMQYSLVRIQVAALVGKTKEVAFFGRFHCWEDQVPLGLRGTSHFRAEQLQHLVQQKITNDNDNTAMTWFVSGKHDTLQKFISQTLQKNNWSVCKMISSQSIPVDWQIKSEPNCAQIQQRFLKEDIYDVVNADETFLLFHPLERSSLLQKVWSM